MKHLLSLLLTKEALCAANRCFSASQPTIALPQAVLDKMLLCIKEIKQNTYQIDDESKPKGSGIMRVLYHNATHHHTDAHTNIPAGQL
jgi:hypothetical protein